MIKYKPQPEKILNSILWLANERPGMDMYRILKILFLADKWHLNTYGRLIAGEKYVAMEYGPVASIAYQILKRESSAKRKLHIKEFPFVMKPDSRGRPVCVHPAQKPDLSDFSKSDLRALGESLDKYGHMSFNALKALTHRHKAYKEAWRDRGDNKSSPIRYENLLEGDNADPEVIDELAYLSQFSPS